MIYDNSITYLFNNLKLEVISYRRNVNANFLLFELFCLFISWDDNDDIKSSMYSLVKIDENQKKKKNRY